MEKFEAFVISSNIARNQGMSLGQQWAMQACMEGHDKKRGSKQKQRRPAQRKKRKLF